MEVKKKAIFFGIFLILVGVVMFFVLKPQYTSEDGLSFQNLRGVNSQAIALRENTTYSSTTITTCGSERCYTEFYSGRVNYWDGSGFIPIDYNIVSSSDPIYEFESIEGTFNVFFRENPDTGETVKFFYNESFLEGNNPHKSGFVTFQPLSLNYRNDLDQLQQISNVQSVTGVASEGTFTYPNIYGEGINLTYISGGIGLFKKLIIEDRTDLVDPEQFIIDGGNPTIEFDFNLGFNDELDIFINGEVWDEAPNNPQETSGGIEFQLDGETLFGLPAPTAQDDVGEFSNGNYLIRRQGNNFFIQVTFDFSWLNDTSRVYPVELDPSIILQDAGTENREDTWVASNQATSNFATDDDLSISNTTDATRVHRQGMFKWNLTQIPSGQQIDYANLTLNLFTGSGFESGEGYNLTTERIWNNYTCSGIDWVETCPTYNTRPLFAGNLSSGLGGFTVVNETNGNAANVDISFNVTGIVRGCYADAELNCSIFLYAAFSIGTPTGAERVRFSSKEDSTTTDRPILNITHSDVGGATCDCPSVNTDWRIADGSQCLLTTVCNIGTGGLFIHSGRLHITASGSLNANSCYVADSQSLYTDDGGGLICRA